MAKTDFAWVNACDAATYTADSEAAALPASNLASPRTGKVWRALATTTFFVASFTAATSINVLALGSCTLSATDTVRHRLYAGPSATGTLLLDTGAIACGVLPGYALHVYKLAAALSPQSWRCDIVATSRASLGYVDIGRAWASPVLQTAVGISRPWDEMWTDDVDIVRGKRSGGLFVGDGPQYRILNVSLDWVSEAEKAQLKEMQRLIGRRYQALIIPDEDGDIPREAVLGRLGALQPVRNSALPVPPVYGVSFNIIQDL